MTVFTNFLQEKVYFGQPFDEALSEEADRLGSRRLFVLGSSTLARETDFMQRLADRLGDRYAGMATGMPAHTPREAVIEMTRAARESKADLVVTFGGGSLTDAGKMVRLALEHGIDDVDGLDPFRTIIDEDGSSHQPDFRPPSVPQVTIPTTLSGGEFNRTAGCTDTRRHAKQLFRHARLIPTAVILDPETTVPTPEWLWLSTGMRAVDHCVETICSHLANWQSDGAAINGLRLLRQGLVRCKADPRDLEARLMCQIGAWQSMEHNQTGVSMGASHGIGHVLGGTCDVPHGHTSCVMLPAALRWNLPANEGRQKIVAEVMGRPGDSAADVVAAFVRSLGQPGRLSDVGVTPNRFREIAEHAMHDRYIHTNPRPITSPEQVIEILELAR